MIDQSVTNLLMEEIFHKDNKQKKKFLHIQLQGVGCWIDGFMDLYSQTEYLLSSANGKKFRIDKKLELLFLGKKHWIEFFFFVHHTVHIFDLYEKVSEYKKRPRTFIWMKI